MTLSRSSHAAVSVVVDPGPPPHTAPWDLQLRGPLDPAVLEDVLGELASGDPGRTGWQHRLLRHGPDHHTLRFIQRDGAIAASVVGRIADLLTEPAVTDRPLVPAQCAVLARPARHRYEAVFIESAVPLDAGVVREALHTVVATHPQLRSRLDTMGGRLTGQAATADGQDLLAEGSSPTRPTSPRPSPRSAARSTRVPASSCGPCSPGTAVRQGRAPTGSP